MPLLLYPRIQETVCDYLVGEVWEWSKKIARISEGRWRICLIGLPQHNSLYTYFQRLPTNAQRVYVGVNHSCDSAIHREAVPNGVCDGIREVSETRVFQKCLETCFRLKQQLYNITYFESKTHLAVLLKSWKRGRAVGSTSESNSRKKEMVTTGRFFANIQFNKAMAKWLFYYCALPWLHQVAELLEHQIFQQTLTWKVCFPLFPPSQSGFRML